MRYPSTEEIKVENVRQMEPSQFQEGLHDLSKAEVYFEKEEAGLYIEKCRSFDILGQKYKNASSNRKDGQCFHGFHNAEYEEIKLEIGYPEGHILFRLV